MKTCKSCSHAALASLWHMLSALGSADISPRPPAFRSGPRCRPSEPRCRPCRCPTRVLAGRQTMIRLAPCGVPEIFPDACPVSVNRAIGAGTSFAPFLDKEYRLAAGDNGLRHHAGAYAPLTFFGAISHSKPPYRLQKTRRRPVGRATTGAIYGPNSSFADLVPALPGNRIIPRASLPTRSAPMPPRFR